MSDRTDTRGLSREPHLRHYARALMSAKALPPDPSAVPPWGVIERAAGGPVLVEMPERVAHDLGAALLAIIDGADARDALGIPRTAGGQRRDKLYFGVLWLRLRAEGHSASAARDALAREHGDATPDIASLRKWYSGTDESQREFIWSLVEQKRWRIDDRGDVIVERLGPDATKLRREMTKSGARDR